MAGLRNLNETLPNGRRIFGTPYIGYTGAEILARAARAAGDVGPGVMNNDIRDPAKRYRMLIVASTIQPYDLTIRDDGSGVIQGYGKFEYDVYEDNIKIVE